MLFTKCSVSVYIDVESDPGLQVNKSLFQKVTQEEAEAVWSDYALAEIQQKVEEFESEYGQTDASGLYQLTNQEGALRVISHPARQYPLDPALLNEQEPGHIPNPEWEQLNESLIEAQKEVARRANERLEEFVNSTD